MIYLNNAATTYPKPQCVLDAHAAALLNPPASQFRSSGTIGKGDVFTQCREKLGRLLGIADAGRIFFSSGATDSINRVLGGLDLSGMQIITTQTEHNSVLRPLMNNNDRIGQLTIIPCNSTGRVDIAALEEAMQRGRGLVIINHCSNVTGMVQDLEQIGVLTQKYHCILMADVSQSAGCIPIHADAWGIDILVFTGHKSLFGVQGTGGYYVSRKLSLRPVMYGGTGRDSSQLTYENGDYEYEVGTQNAPGIAALSAGLTYIEERGLQEIQKKEQQLMKQLYRSLEQQESVQLYGNAEHHQGPVMSFNIKGMSPSDVAYILQNGYDIVVRTGLHCAPMIHAALGTGIAGTVRISISDLNQEQDIIELTEAVNQICRASVTG